MSCSSHAHTLRYLLFLVHVVVQLHVAHTFLLLSFGNNSRDSISPCESREPRSTEASEAGRRLRGTSVVYSTRWPPKGDQW
jgi:hypothetical protein